MGPLQTMNFEFFDFLEHLVFIKTHGSTLNIIILQPILRYDFKRQKNCLLRILFACDVFQKLVEFPRSSVCWLLLRPPFLREKSSRLGFLIGVWMVNLIGLHHCTDCCTEVFNYQSDNNGDLRSVCFRSF